MMRDGLLWFMDKGSVLLVICKVQHMCACSTNTPLPIGCVVIYEWNALKLTTTTLNHLW